MQFALFAGETYYPRGGWCDLWLVGSPDECKARLSSWCDYAPKDEYTGFDWAHIVNLSTMRIEFVAEGDGTEVVVWRKIEETAPT